MLAPGLEVQACVQTWCAAAAIRTPARGSVPWFVQPENAPIQRRVSSCHRSGPRHVWRAGSDAASFPGSWKFSS